MKVPEQIMAAADSLLAPFGVAVRQLVESPAEKAKEEFLTVGDVERRFAISRWKLYRARRAGLIRTVKLSRARGGKVLVSLKSLRAWLVACEESESAKIEE